MTRPDGCTCTYLDNIHADTCTLIDGPLIGTPPVINHDDIQPPPWHPTGTAADFMATEANDDRRPTPVDRINHDDGHTIISTTTASGGFPTPDEAAAKETAYSDGLHRGFAEALDALRAGPTALELEAAVLIRQRAHEWRINL